MEGRCERNISHATPSRGEMPCMRMPAATTRTASAQAFARFAEKNLFRRLRRSKVVVRLCVLYRGISTRTSERNIDPHILLDMTGSSTNTSYLDLTSSSISPPSQEVVDEFEKACRDLDLYFIQGEQTDAGPIRICLLSHIGEGEKSGDREQDEITVSTVVSFAQRPTAANIGWILDGLIKAGDLHYTLLDPDTAAEPCQPENVLDRLNRAVETMSEEIQSRPALSMVYPLGQWHQLITDTAQTTLESDKTVTSHVLTALASDTIHVDLCGQQPKSAYSGYTRDVPTADDSRRKLCTVLGGEDALPLTSQWLGEVIGDTKSRVETLYSAQDAAE